jgi:hypothetical protein
VASHRIDNFAIEGKSLFLLRSFLTLNTPVFESSARLSVLTSNSAQLLSSLSGLVPGLYTAVDKGKSKAPPRALEDRIQTLELEDRKDCRIEMVSLLLLFHLCHTDSHSAYFSTLVELTQPTTRILRTPFRAAPPQRAPSTPEPFAQVAQVDLAIRTARYLAEETFNPLAYFVLLDDDSTVGAYERVVISWAKDKVRERAWGIMAKAYLSCPLGRAARVIGESEEGTEKFAISRGKVLAGGSVKMR